MPFKKINNFLFNFFHFNKQERNGVFVLCILISVLFMIRMCIPYFGNHENEIKFSKISNQNQQDSVLDFNERRLSNNDKNYSNQLFVFNPNTITENDAQKLGFSKKLSATLVNYRSKGGKFFKPEDLKKLYGLSPKLYEELESYILIPSRQSMAKNNYKQDSVYTNTPRSFEKKVYPKKIVELNSADSLSIVYLKGIGPGFTKRIMKYRSMLGGFHSVNQLKEVYGMTDSVYVLLVSQIKLDENAITKIPINAIDFNSLRKYPYFNFQSAQAIINYRSKHGKLTEVDIKNLGIFSEEKLSLILPYLSY